MKLVAVIDENSHMGNIHIFKMATLLNFDYKAQ